MYRQDCEQVSKRKQVMRSANVWIQTCYSAATVTELVSLANSSYAYLRAKLTTNFLSATLRLLMIGKNYWSATTTSCLYSTPFIFNISSDRVSVECQKDAFHAASVGLHVAAGLPGFFLPWMAPATRWDYWFSSCFDESMRRVSDRDQPCCLSVRLFRMCASVLLARFITIAWKRCRVRRGIFVSKLAMFSVHPISLRYFLDNQRGLIHC